MTCRSPRRRGSTSIASRRSGREARETWGAKAGGPFLFGGYTIADAMYMPVCARFRTYGVKLGPLSEAYVEAVLSDPDYLVWEDACRRDEPAEIIG